MMVKSKMMRFAAIAVTASTLATSAVSGTLLYATQSALQNHGYYDDDPDGKMGPKTRSALSAYALDRNIEGDLPSVYSDMIARNYDQRKEITDQDFLDDIKEEVSAELRDPSSANFRNIYKISGISFGGNKVNYVCGEVNGKNAYGAYAGYNRFYGLDIHLESSDIRIFSLFDILDSETMATMVCDLTFE